MANQDDEEDTFGEDDEDEGPKAKASPGADAAALLEELAATKGKAVRTERSLRRLLEAIGVETVEAALQVVDALHEDQKEKVAIPLVRAPVAWFAAAMESELKSNDHKGGWHGDSISSLVQRLREEVAELEEALVDRLSAEAIAEEAADVANFAMMIADNARSLEEEATQRAIHSSRIASIEAAIAEQRTRLEKEEAKAPTV